MYYYGIRCNIQNLLSSYLLNRHQYVETNIAKTGHDESKCGVPQSSVPGLLLFVIYINDPDVNLSADRVCLYVDDTSVVIKAKIADDKNTNYHGRSKKSSLPTNYN